MPVGSFMARPSPGPGVELQLPKPSIPLGAGDAHPGHGMEGEVRAEGQGWDDMGPVEEVKVLLRTPPHHRTDGSPPAPPLVLDGGSQGGAPPPDQNHIGAPGCDAGRKGVFLVACPGSLSSGGTIPASDPRPWPDQPSLLSEDREVGGQGWWWGYLFGCTVFRERLNRVWSPARGPPTPAQTFAVAASCPL